MAYRVVWSPRAVEDLEAIAQYIAMDSSAYAAAVVERVLNIARYLSRFPYARRIVPEFADENLRVVRLYLSNYLSNREPGCDNRNRSALNQIE